MTYARQLLVVFGIGGVMLPLLVPGCTTLNARKEMPLPPVPKEQAAKPEAPKVEEVGNASWYGPAHDGKETASGETSDSNEMTAAHPTLPMGTKAVVTNMNPVLAVRAQNHLPDYTMRSLEAENTAHPSGATVWASVFGACSSCG